MHPSLALLLTAVIVLANAFFVAAEFAFVKIRPTRLQQLAREGRRRAKLLLAHHQQLPAYLSASQLGITVASLSLGWLGEPAFAALLRPWLYRAGVTHRAHAAHAGRRPSASSSSPSCTPCSASWPPRRWRIQLTEPIAMWAVVPFRAFYVARPSRIIWTLKGAAALVLKILRLPPASEAEMVHSPDELRLVLQHVQLDPGARRLIDRVFDYTHRLARHVMTLRRDVVTLEAGRPFEDNLRIAVANQYTRYPLVEPTTDRVVGYVHLKDIVSGARLGQAAAADARAGARADLRLGGHAPRVAAARVPAPARAHRHHPRPRTRFTGIVTLEDLVEEVVGEIQDEQDAEEIPPIRRNADGSFDVDGRLTLDVAARDLGLEFPQGAARDRDAGRLHHHAAPRAAGAGRRDLDRGLSLHRARRARSAHPPAARRPAPRRGAPDRRRLMPCISGELRDPSKKSLTFLSRAGRFLPLTSMVRPRWYRGLGAGTVALVLAAFVPACSPNSFDGSGAARAPTPAR